MPLPTCTRVEINQDTAEEKVSNTVIDDGGEAKTPPSQDLDIQTPSKRSTTKGGKKRILDIAEPEPPSPKLSLSQLGAWDGPGNPPKRSRESKL